MTKPSVYPCVKVYSRVCELVSVPAFDHEKKIQETFTALEADMNSYLWYVENLKVVTITSGIHIYGENVVCTLTVLMSP